MFFGDCREVCPYHTTEFGLPKNTGPGGAGGACTNAMLKFLSDERPDDTWVSLLVRGEIKTRF